MGRTNGRDAGRPAYGARRIVFVFTHGCIPRDHHGCKTYKNLPGRFATVRLRNTLQARCHPERSYSTATQLG